MMLQSVSISALGLFPLPVCRVKSGAKNMRRGKRAEERGSDKIRVKSDVAEA